jgi:hypothetical protein
MKIIPLFLCAIFFCCITISNTNAAGNPTTSLNQADLLKEHYYQNHPRLFKEFEYDGKKVIVNIIANIPEIFDCGTPIKKSRIAHLIKEIHKILAQLENTFKDIKVFKSSYLRYTEESREILQSDIHIDTLKNFQQKLLEFKPITINEIIANLSVLSDFIGASQANVSEYLKAISLQTREIQDALNKATDASVAGFVQKTSIQALLEQAISLNREQNKLLSLLEELNSAQSVVQNASHLLTDFYLQTRSAEGSARCPTDVYLRYLNTQIPDSDALAIASD